MRPSKLQNYMEIAETVAKRSHDAETKVGSILINNASGAIIATAFNGFVRGAPDAILPNVRPDKYKFIIHSELNLISNCARHGISMEDTTVICTMSPCVQCTRFLANCGVTQVIVKTLYKDFDEVLAMEDIKVQLNHEADFYKITYCLVTQ